MLYSQYFQQTSKEERRVPNIKPQLQNKRNHTKLKLFSFFVNITTSILQNETVTLVAEPQDVRVPTVTTTKNIMCHLRHFNDFSMQQPSYPVFLQCRPFVQGIAQEENNISWITESYALKIRSILFFVWSRTEMHYQLIVIFHLFHEKQQTNLEIYQKSRKV
jgi:hypothetical protein